MKTFQQQVKTFRTEYAHGAEKFVLVAQVRFDDDCGNGHNTFSITADTFSSRGMRRGPSTLSSNGKARWLVACGCLHEDVAKHFPKLAPLLKWHLCSDDGPMHYIENTCYLAGDRDCWGYRRGEQKRDKQGRLMWMLPSDGFPARTLYQDEKPVIGDIEYVPVLAEGKERELDKARDAAIWPDATDDELTAPGLKERLEARLPALMTEFRAAVESIGLKWTPC